MTSRIIQGSGLWLFTDEERRNQRLRLLGRVIFDEFILGRSINFEWPADRSLWGRYQWIRNGLVAREGLISYLDQVLFEWDNDSAMAAQQAYCTAVSVAQNFVQVGLGAATAPTCQPVIAPCPYSGVLVQLVPGCQLQVFLDILPLQSCCGDPVWANDNAPPEATPPGGLPRRPSSSNDLNSPDKKQQPSPPYGGDDDRGYTDPDGTYGGPNRKYCITFAAALSNNDSAGEPFPAYSVTTSVKPPYQATGGEYIGRNSAARQVYSQVTVLGAGGDVAAVSPIQTLGAPRAWSYNIGVCPAS